MKTKHFLKLLFFFFFMISSQWVAAEEAITQPKVKTGYDWNTIRRIPILNEGRQKPLDTFARETVRSVTGREKFSGFDPVELLFSWMTSAPQWEKLPLIDAHYRPLNQHVGLKLDGNRASPESLKNNEAFKLFVQTAMSNQEQNKKLSEKEKEALLLQKRVNEFYSILSGQALTVLPRAAGGWESVGELFTRYPKVSLDKAAPNADVQIAVAWEGLFRLYSSGQSETFNQVAAQLKTLLRHQGNQVDKYLSEKQIQREVHFNQLDPFQWAWVGYALACFILLLSFAVKGRWMYFLGTFVILIAFGLHIYGFILRVMISGRAPVTNMYETVIWVPFGMILFALILEAIYRKRIFAIAGSAVASIGLIVAQSAPRILDPSIDPLVPVLRDNFWLTVHVLTITLSYGAFSLALGVANICAGYFIFKPQAKSSIRQLNLFTYRAIQVGVVLLTAGTILGGVWANASWGRFWGWDPKEVWALIALLCYLVILHGRYIGWIREFGLMAGATLCYLSVMMAWYGVNFVLGAGLHSYGFASGGAPFVVYFVAIEFIWLALAAIRYWTKPSSPQKLVSE